ncbi:MAG: formylglycine-generating enzyme family protein [Planctomycetota bacterium]
MSKRQAGIVCLLCLGLTACGPGSDDLVQTEPALMAKANPPTEAAEPVTPPSDVPGGMVFVPGGGFTMGWDGPEGRADESPAHRVRVDGFFMDATEVTNAQFRAFVEATGYITTAERAVEWEEMKKQVPPGTPKPDAALLQPGSLVFIAPDRPVPLNNIAQWWSWVNGASWKHPQGPGSSIEGMDDYPVVQISWDDANAYAQWAGKRLPTEAEWERAARYGQDQQVFAWGDTLEPDGQHMANIWQGSFPYRNTAEDGHPGIAPVGQYPASPLGLYDMAGNVWEWTADKFNPQTYALRISSRTGQSAEEGCCINPTGPTRVFDPRNPYAPDSRVMKGGSFLCHFSYCTSYRPSAKMSSSPDSAMSHMGFRCVMDVPTQTSAVR